MSMGSSAQLSLSCPSLGGNRLQVTVQLFIDCRSSQETIDMPMSRTARWRKTGNIQKFRRGYRCNGRHSVSGVSPGDGHCKSKMWPAT
ncbi:hypothetical protein EI94DRAFT_996866 [Lactarius quietus]|nr:hypothetical protein EI94DRAFT_996866 [Lactarius quietus]